MMIRRVVVTGAGCVTPLGTDVAAFWHRLIAGDSGIGVISQFDASRFPVRIAAEVRDWGEAGLATTVARWADLPRQTLFAIAAAIQAGEQEELEHARRRRASIWGELRGFASTHDAHNISAPDPGGTAAARCIRLALDDANLDPEDIEYINAHGSSTVLNDKAETVAIKRAFGPHAYHVPISSTKSMTGHLTTACGAIEMLACLLAVH